MDGPFVFQQQVNGSLQLVVGSAVVQRQLHIGLNALPNEGVTAAGAVGGHRQAQAAPVDQGEGELGVALAGGHLAHNGGLDALPQLGGKQLGGRVAVGIHQHHHGQVHTEASDSCTVSLPHRGRSVKTGPSGSR